MKEIKIGDVVYLNSQSNLPMTVVYIDNRSNKVQCIYFNAQSYAFVYTPMLPIESVTKED